MTRYDIAKFYGYNSPEEYDEAKKRKYEIFTESLKRQKPYVEKEPVKIQPVNRGRWIDIYEWAKMHDSTPSGMCTYYWCSECQKEQEKKSNFCPNCGARMIKDGDEE